MSKAWRQSARWRRWILFYVIFSCRWGILFSHPADYTPVCTTELSRAAKLADEFKKRGVKMIALSIDSVEDHKNWSKVKHSNLEQTQSACGSTDDDR